MIRQPEARAKRRRLTPRRAALGWIVLCLSLVGCAQNMRDGSRLRPYEPSTFFDDGQSARPLLPGTVARGELRTDEQFYTGMTGGAGAGDTVSSEEQEGGTGGGTGQEGQGGQGESGTGQDTAGGPSSGGQGGGSAGDPGLTDSPGAGSEGQGDTSAEGSTGQNQSGQGGGTPVDTFPYPVTRDILDRGQVRYNTFCAPCHAITGYGDGMIVQRGFSAPPSFHTERLREAPVGYYFDVITNGFGRMYAYGSRITPADRWAIIAYIRALQLSQNATIEDVPADERQQLQGAGE